MKRNINRYSILDDLNKWCIISLKSSTNIWAIYYTCTVYEWYCIVAFANIHNDRAKKQKKTSRRNNVQAAEKKK